MFYVYFLFGVVFHFHVYGRKGKRNPPPLDRWILDSAKSCREKSRWLLMLLLFWFYTTLNFLGVSFWTLGNLFFWIPNISTFFVFKKQKNQNGLWWYCDPLGSFLARIISKQLSQPQPEYLGGRIVTVSWCVTLHYIQVIGMILQPHQPFSTQHFNGCSPSKMAFHDF